jgi:hypothetical protein
MNNGRWSQRQVVCGVRAVRVELRLRAARPFDVRAGGEPWRPVWHRVERHRQLRQRQSGGNGNGTTVKPLRTGPQLRHQDSVTHVHSLF